VPAKKKSLKAKLQPWQQIAGFVSSVALIVGGVGVFAYQQYTQAQVSAAIAAESAIEIGEQSFEQLSERIGALELAIRNSEQTLVNTEGQTLDEQERKDLLAEIEVSKEIWAAQKTKLLELEAAIKALQKEIVSGTTPQENLASLAGNILALVNSDWEQINAQIVALGDGIGFVKTAQEAWKIEQDRIAAERAAAQIAAIEKATAEALAKQATETTSIVAPPASADPVIESSTPTPGMIAVQDYILTMATNVTFLWDPDLCAVGFVCGRANPAPIDLPSDFLHASRDWGYTGAPRTPEHAHVFILLDNSFEDFYMNTGLGRAILVHEAAHARQWLKYGKDIIRANELYVNLIGTAAVEYMADCATIVKLDFSTGAYTNQCTDSQYAAAATIW